MSQTLAVVIVVLLVVVVALLAVDLVRNRQGRVILCLESLERGQERSERLLREEMERGRVEAARCSHQLREEVGAAVKGWGDTAVNNIGALGLQQKAQSDILLDQMAAFANSNGQRMTELRTVVDAHLQRIQDDNAAKLEQMRQTVDERLNATLEKRLGDSFRQVSERLEAVHKGLGEMQVLAAGVGDLKRVLGNVKTRGTWGEVQLGMLLEQVLAPGQYEANVVCRGGSGERVEYAIRLPGLVPGDDGGPVWLPIDAKFPVEDYQRMLDAQGQGDMAGVESALRSLETRVRQSAKDILSKYVDPPRTTDFGVMYLPTEGLYAEVLRRPGLAESLQRDCRVIVAGPTTLAALLNSLQMGFRTLAIQERSSEVWRLLGAVKTQFGQFGGLLERVQNKLSQASSSIEEAARKTRTIERSLRDVEEIPAENLVGPLPQGRVSPPVGEREDQRSGATEDRPEEIPPIPAAG